MLGLADKSKLIKLLKHVFDGNESDALELLRQLIEDGLDAKNFLESPEYEPVKQIRLKNSKATSIIVEGF